MPRERFQSLFGAIRALQFIPDFYFRANIASSSKMFYLNLCCLICFDKLYITRSSNFLHFYINFRIPFCNRITFVRQYIMWRNVSLCECDNSVLLSLRVKSCQEENIHHQSCQKIAIFSFSNWFVHTLDN